MPRWLIIVIASLALAFWLFGAGLQIAGRGAEEPSTDQAATDAEKRFGGLAGLLPQPAPLAREDVELSDSCGRFPSLMVPVGGTCGVRILEGDGRRRAKFALVPNHRVRLVVLQSLPGRESRPQELDQDQSDGGHFDLQFGKDGGRIDLTCLVAQPACSLTFGR